MTALILTALLSYLAGKLSVRVSPTAEALARVQMELELLRTGLHGEN
jgi:hypothetical protein